MKISLEWLNTYLDRPAAAGEVEQLLTGVGFPIEERTVVSWEGQRDEMIDAEITSNRPDCLSHVGLAREVVSGSKRQLLPPDCSLPPEAGPAVEEQVTVVNEAPELCPVYTARLICGVKVGPSPAWLVRRLATIGLRSVNNVVDVTNYVLMELGQPLHAFDLARLNGRKIVIRRASQGEGFTAIDGSKHTLKDPMLVIADADKPVAVAAVMGGLDSEVGAQSADILLESAQFAPLSVRRTSRALKLSSDSSYRFERGVDPEGVELASRRAARLILALAGGTLCKGVIRAGAVAPVRRQVSMRVARCRSILGIDVPVPRMQEILGQLGLSPQLDAAGERISATIPGFRLDLEREIDLIEEVGRQHGLDQIPVREKVAIVARNKQPEIEARQKLGQVLVAQGYHETVTFSFIAPRLGGLFVPAGSEAVLVDDERRKAEPMLRPSLLPSLLACRKANQDVGNHQVRLFETAAAWSRQDGRIVERRTLGLIADSADASVGLRQLKGLISELIERLGADVAVRYVAGQAAGMSSAAQVLLAGQPIGALGLIDQATQGCFDLQSQVVGAELELTPLLAMYPPRRAVRSLPRFPAIERDLSVVVEEQVSWEELAGHVRAAQPAALEQVEFITVYRGKPIPAGRKSLSLRLIFRDPQGTLRHEQVDGEVAKVVQQLRQQVAAELRT